MGYDTRFNGEFKLDTPLSVSEFVKLNELAQEAHDDRKNPEFPSMYCQWKPTREGTAIIWDGNEKFYEYVDWLKYIIKNYINLWGLKLSGSVEWTGEERGDFGTITVDNNVVIVEEG